MKFLLVKKYDKRLLQKSERKIFGHKKFPKKLIQSQREKANQVMSKFLTLSKCLQLNC